MALYGYKAMPQRSSDPYKDYFKEVRNDIEAISLADKVKNETEELALESIGSLPSVEPNSMYLSYSDAYKQMATYLRDNKDELMKTEEGRAQYQELLNEASQWSKYGKNHTKEVDPILSSRTKIASSGVNPTEWESQGQRDRNSYEDYVAKTQELDSARFQVGVKEGRWVLSDEKGEHSVQDESLFDLRFFKDFLEDTPAISPDVWYTTHKPRNDSKAFKNKEEASEWVRGTILSSQGRARRDAIQWYVGSDQNVDGLTVSEIKADETGNAIDRAVSAYADQSVANWEAYVPEPSKKNQTPKKKYEGVSDQFNMLINLEDNFGGTSGYTQEISEDGTEQSYAQDFTSVYNFTGKAKAASPSISAYPGLTASKIKSIEYNYGGSYWTINLQDGSSEMFNFNPESESYYVEDSFSDSGEKISKMSFYKSQFDKFHGEGSFVTMLKDLQGRATEQV